MYEVTIKKIILSLKRDKKKKLYENIDHRMLVMQTKRTIKIMLAM